MRLHEFREALEVLEGSAPLILSASFDLRPGTTGRPTASIIVREAIRANRETGDWDEARLGRLEEQVTQAIEEAIATGAPGLFLAGPVEEPTAFVARAAIPPRHTLRLAGEVGWLELERQVALTRPVVASVWADRGSVQSVIVRGEDEPLLTQIEADVHHMERSPGRTGQHDRGGTADMPAGGHGKMRIEESAEEERERFARVAAALIERKLDDPDAVVFHGPPEFGARLISELSPRLQDRIVSDGQYRDRPDAVEQAREARERAAQLQFEQARELRDQIRDGAFGGLAVSGPEALMNAAREGRLDAVVLDEDSVGHFGDAIDARRHEPTRDEARIEALLRAAREQGATCWFIDTAAVAEADGATGTLRW